MDRAYATPITTQQGSMVEDTKVSSSLRAETSHFGVWVRWEVKKELYGQR